MARARNIKPSFFTNELLGTCDPMIALLFAGLWCLADKDGILEDRPLRIKAELFPYRDNQDVNGYLTELQRLGFVTRYEANGSRYILVNEFEKHQHPHHTEKPKGYPKPQAKSRECSLTPLSNGYTPSDSLIPDSLIPDSGFTDSLISDSPKEPKSKPLQPATPTATKKKVLTDEETALQSVCRETWGAYSAAYCERYSTDPVRNAKVSGQVKQYCQRVPAGEAPAIAAFYVRHNAGFYVAKLHPVGLLLADAEKLRTEWATNRTITATQAQQSDRTQANGNIFGKLIAEAKERERNESNQQAV